MKSAGLALLALGLLLGACSSSHTDSRSTRPTASEPVVVPVAVSGGQGTPKGAHPMVEVRVGRSKQVPVLLDTGSVGLHIFSAAVSTGTGSGVELTSTRQSITYSGGSRFTGVEAYAVIMIGSQATASAVGFALVQQASCTASKADCPTAKGMGQEIAAGEYGILGIGVNRAPSGLASPLLAMPGALGRTWSIHLRGHSGALVLGAPVASSTTATTIHLRPQGAIAHGRSWADADVSLCFSVGSMRSCAPSLFDTGTFAMQLTGKPFAQVPRATGTSSVLPGTAVAISVEGAPRPFWTFRVGKTKSEDTVYLRAGERDFVNCAVQAFYSFTIDYDDAAGTMTLVPNS